MDVAKNSRFSAFSGLLLAFLWYWVLHHWVAEFSFRYLMALSFTPGHGFLDEWLQILVQGLVSTDVGFEVIGAVIGLLIYRCWFTVEKRRPD